MTPKSKGANALRTRNHRVQVRLNDKEYAKLEKLISASGLSKEAFIRKCVFDKSVIISQNPRYHELIRKVSQILNTYLHDLNLQDIPSERLALGQLMVEKTWLALKELK